MSKKRPKKSKTKTYLAKVKSAFSFDWSAAASAATACVLVVAAYAAIMGAFIGILELAQKIAGSPLGAVGLIVAVVTLGVAFAAGKGWIRA